MFRERLSVACFNRIDLELGDKVFPILQQPGASTPEDVLARSDFWALPGVAKIRRDNLKLYLAMKLEEVALHAEAVQACAGS